MREIKFRAWDKTLKVMAYDIQEYYDNLGYDYTPTEVHATFNCFLNNEFQEVMQYTGLKDKNGKEIYEGDILKFIDHKEIKRVGSVSWVTCAFGVDYSDIEGLFGKNSVYLQTFIKSSEVIGNIYENPELLEGK